MPESFNSLRNITA